MPTAKKAVSAKTIARKLLALFGSDGEHWMKGNYDDGEGNYCLIGGLQAMKMTSRGRPVLTKAIKEITGQKWSVEEFNDSRTSWREIKQVLCHIAFPKKESK